MNAFYRKINKLNRGNISWIVIWGLSIIAGSLLMSNTEDGKFIGTHYLTIFAILFLIVEASIFYIRKHMVLFDGSGISRSRKELVVSVSRMEMIMKLHSFDLTKYFGLISKRLILAQILAALVTIIFGIISKSSVALIIVIAAVFLVLPQLVLFIYRKLAERSMMNERGTVTKVLIGFFGGILSTVGLIIGAIMAILVLILTLAIISSNVLMNGIDNDSVTRIVTTSVNIPLLICIFSTVFLIFSFMNDSVVFSFIGKYKKAGTIVAFLVLIISGAMFILNGYSHNTMITEEAIAVKNGFSGENFIYIIDEDIKSFHIYEGDGSIKMDITFNDGRTTGLIGDSSEETDGWTTKYSSDYKFIAELTSRLQNNNVPGTFDDQDDLAKIVSGYDKEIQDDFNDLIALWKD